MLGWRLEVMVVRLTSVAQCWGWSEQNPRTGKCKIDFGTRMPCRHGHAIQRHKQKRQYTCLYNAHEDATHEQEQTIQWHSKSNNVKMYDSNDILQCKVCDTKYALQCIQCKCYTKHMHSLGSTKLHTMGDDPTHNANVGRDMQLKGGGEGQLTVACFLYFMQFNLYTPTGCLHCKPNNMHI